ncbi:MAG: hypothetical protein Q8M16_18405 [Pirellulaceae bacterium]|nr:hypothetical protein [Pirellulaceae bacterium]
MRLTKWGMGLMRQRRGLAQLGIVTWLMGAAALGGMTVLTWVPNQDPTQEQDEPPPRGAVLRQEQKVDEEEAVLPRGLRGIGRLRGPIQMQFNQQFGGGTSGGISYSRSSNNGVTTTVMTEGDQQLKMEETSDGIFLEIGKSYTRKDVEQLKSTHPELAKALEAFPTVADGNDVELSVRAVKKYEAVNEEDLKEEHPEAYEQYLKLVEIGKGEFRGGFPGGEGFEMPGIGEIRAQHERMRQEMEKMLERIR